MVVKYFNSSYNIWYQFVYDSVYIATDVSFRDSDAAKSVHAAQARTAVYPLRYVDAGNALQGPNNYGFTPIPPVSGVSSCNF